jgi:hypothetical protein
VVYIFKPVFFKKFGNKFFVGDAAVNKLHAFGR